jgi:hypothetical protein
VHVVAIWPLQAGWLGEQTCALQDVVTLSQYWEVEHVLIRVELSPLALQRRSSLPEQERVPAVHTTGKHAPATHT